MEFAVQWVPEQKDMDYVGMVNKGACRMLLSKLYMSIGEFGKAKEQLDILIDKSGYSLMKESFGTFFEGDGRCGFDRDLRKSPSRLSFCNGK